MSEEITERERELLDPALARLIDAQRELARASEGREKAALEAERAGAAMNATADVVVRLRGLDPATTGVQVDLDERGEPRYRIVTSPSTPDLRVVPPE